MYYCILGTNVGGQNIPSKFILHHDKGKKSLKSPEHMITELDPPTYKYQFLQLNIHLILSI